MSVKKCSVIQATLSPSRGSLLASKTRTTPFHITSNWTGSSQLCTLYSPIRNVDAQRDCCTIDTCLSRMFLGLDRYGAPFICISSCMHTQRTFTQMKIQLLVEINFSYICTSKHVLPSWTYFYDIYKLWKKFIFKLKRTGYFTLNVTIFHTT